MIAECWRFCGLPKRTINFKSTTLKWIIDRKIFGHIIRRQKIQLTTTGKSRKKVHLYREQAGVKHRELNWYHLNRRTRTRCKKTKVVAAISNMTHQGEYIEVLGWDFYCRRRTMSSIGKYNIFIFISISGLVFSFK